MPKICPRYAQDMPEICPKYAQDMHKICTRYAQDMTTHKTVLTKCLPDKTSTSVLTKCLPDKTSKVVLTKRLLTVAAILRETISKVEASQGVEDGCGYYFHWLGRGQGRGR